MSVSNETLSNAITAMTGGSACMFDHDSDGDLRITVLGAVQGQGGLIGTKDEFEDEFEPKEWVIRGKVEIDFEATVTIEDEDTEISDLAEDVVEQIRLGTDLPGSVEAQGQTVWVSFESSDGTMEDYDEA